MGRLYVPKRRLFSPTFFTGLILWLDGQDPSTLIRNIAGNVLAADGETVERWADKSGLSHHCDQPLVGPRPTVSSTALNGRRGLVWDGADELDSGPFVTNQPLTVYVVLLSLTSGLRCAFDSHGGDKSSIYGAAGGGGFVEIYAGTLLVNPVSLTSAQSVCGVFNGASSVCRVGSSEVLGPAGAGGDNTGVRIGGHGSIPGTFNWDGSIVEVIAFDTAHTLDERNIVMSYLMAKWVTPL